MAKELGRPNDDPSSAPESGTVRDETSGNKPSERSNNIGPTSPADKKHGYDKAVKGGDDVSVAGEER